MRKSRAAIVGVLAWLAGAAPGLAAYAIAFNPSSGRTGAFNGTFDLGAAKKEALSRCGSGCRVVASGKRYCAAVVASGPGKPWAAGSGTTSGAAASSATFACRSKGGVDCRTAATICE